MKLLKIIVSNLALFQNDLIIDFSASQKNTGEACEALNHVKGIVYTNPIIELTGLNASGKTVTMRIIRFIISILNGKSINDSSKDDKNLILSLIDKKPIKIRVYFLWDNSYYVLETSVFKKYPLNGIGDPSLYFTEENLFRKRKGIRETKRNWAEEDLSGNSVFYEKYKDRRAAGEFLPNDVSINVSIVNKSGNPIECCDFVDSVNHNYLKVYGDYIPEILNFLDPNIEFLKMRKLEGTNKSQWILKFKNNENEITLNNFHDLESYLSSGTIKGIGLFTMAIAMFCNSGYILVDELENHFNLKIVETLLDFFLDHNTNKTGATLIFSTHYPELMDYPERNDSIYLLSNNGKIKCQNLSEIKERNDGMKVSQAFKSNLLGSRTAPEYEAYNKLRKVIKNIDFAEKSGEERLEIEI